MTKVNTDTIPKKIESPKLKLKSFPIVGIGGSAGSFRSLEKFFTNISADTGLAFVIIMHLDPDHKGHLAELIQRFTPMPVVEAGDGMQVMPNHVYIIPPNKDIAIHNRKLLLLSPIKAHGLRQPIDYFLQSLAEDQRNKAVAIIFSGMGSDGETGVKMIKEKLGLTMVEDPQTAQYDSMPLASIATNHIDYVLSPEEMPLRLIQYLNHPVMTENIAQQARSGSENSISIDKILMMLRSHTGHDFSMYKKSTITRRIDRRVAFHQLDDYQGYVDYLRENPQEITLLFNELLIGVTRFFRDEEAYASLKIRISALLSSKKHDESVRIWIAGCSTGEEAYSVAILFLEALQSSTKKKGPKIQIFATDLDPEAIETARSGQYYDNIAAYVSPERLKHHFVNKDGFYIVNKELREMIVFAQHNLIKDAPFTRLDLLCCRNLMIYFTSELQKKLIPVFHYSLNPHGILFLGPAETIGGFTDKFTAIDPKWKLFERKNNGTSNGKPVDFPFQISKPQIHEIRIDEGASLSGKQSPQSAFNRILLENFSLPAVLINEKGDILYNNGKTGKYLELPSGEAVMNIHKMAKEDLRYALGNIIHQARSQNGIAEIPSIKFSENDQVRAVSIKAVLLHEANLQGLVLIIFEDKGLIKKSRSKSGKAEDENSLAVQELKKELVYTKQQLNNTIEQMETSLEELKSTNEELQSTNEELQSTNEESLTTKEEMQSLNEEHMTINVQYQAKAEELSRLNNDMKNLLDATEVGTVFLDNERKILRFTPQVRNLFNLIPTDVGRPIIDIAANFECPSLEEDITEVIERLAIKQTEIKTKTGEWYTLRIIPYRTLDNFISGAVITFTLIATSKQLKYKIKALKNYTSEVVSDLNNAAIQLDNEFNILTVNQQFLQLFQVKEKSVKTHSFIDFIKHHSSSPNLEKLLHDCQRSGNPMISPIKINETTDKKYELSANPFVDESVGETLLILVMIIES